MDIDIRQGDCLHLMGLIPDHSIDALVTDPPFAFAGGISNGRSSAVDGQFFLHWWKDVCKHLNRILRPDGEGFIWCDWKSASIIAEGFQEDQKYTWRAAQMLYHYREMPGQGQPFRNSVDQILYVRGPKSKGVRIPNTTHNWISKYWYYGKHDNHPSEKDPAIARQLIDWCSDEGQTVIDPFMGAGTTGLACAAARRKFVGLEMSEEYVLTAKRRIADLEQQPELFVMQPDSLSLQALD